MPNPFKKNKKGDTTWFKELAILSFAAFLVIAIIGFFTKLEAAVLTEEDDGSRANFENRLYKMTRELMEDAAERSYKIDNYFLGKGIVMGFDTEWDDNKKIINVPRWPDSNAYKPFLCGNSACLCLYGKRPSTDAAKRDEGVKACRSETFAGKNVVFYSENGDVAPKSAGVPRNDVGGNYLVFYGEGFGVQPIYTEKLYKKDENKYYIYISKIDVNNGADPANIRKKSIDDSRKAASSST